MKIPKVAILILALSLNSSRANPANFTGVGVAREAVWIVTPVSGSRDLRIVIECSGFSAVQVSGGYSLRIPGQASSGEPGTPDVPRLAKLISGVKGAKAVLTMHGKDPTNLADVVVAPAEGFKLADPESPMRKLKPYRECDPGIYGKDQLWPAEAGRVDEASIGTQKVVRVEYYPVYYNPITKAIRFYRRLEGELRFEPVP